MKPTIQFIALIAIIIKFTILSVQVLQSLIAVMAIVIKTSIQAIIAISIKTAALVDWSLCQIEKRAIAKDSSEIEDEGA